MDILAEKLGEVSGGDILDVATGRGNFIELLIEYLKDYRSITGIDSSEKAVDGARKSITKDNVSFLKMDAGNMSFKDNSFDTVCISNSLHHLSDIDNVLGEMNRVIKPGGLFIINEMYSDNQSETQLTHVYLHNWWGEIDSAMGITHNKTYKRQEIIDIAQRIGLKSVNTFEYGNEGDPKDKENVEYILNVCDTYIERANGHPGHERFKRKGEELKERLISTGISSATELFIMGRK
jgi:ubiquinone/menaquinone biosynthesis C-methylase UbiE